MKSTYINDNMSSVYPFAADVHLPFPLYSIIGCGVCLAPLNGGVDISGKRVMISSIELGDNRVVATIAAPDGTRVGTVEWHDGVSRCSSVKSADWAMTGWIMPGKLDAGCWGTYYGDFWLDPSCVTLLPKYMTGAADSIRINGREHSVPPVMSMMAEGYIDGTDLRYNEDANSYGVGDMLWTLSGDVPANVNLTNAVAVSNYRQVTAINNAIVPTGRSATGVLLLDMCVSSGGSLIRSNAVEPYVSIYIDNAHTSSSIIGNGGSMTVNASTGQRSTFTPGLFSELSDAVIITIVGGSSIPSCYPETSDDAGTDMTSTWTNLKSQVTS